MRSIVLALVIINGFLGLGLLARKMQTPESRQPVQEMSDIHILPYSSHVEAPSHCVELGPFSAQEIDAVRRMIETLSLTDRVSSVESPVVIQWWVNIPPRPSRADALRRTRELERLGIKEWHLFDDSGPVRHAISLGLFRSEAAAQTRLAELVRKGVKGARVDQQENRRAQTVFYVTDPDADTIARLTSVKAQFGSSELRPVNCPALRRN